MLRRLLVGFLPLVLGFSAVITVMLGLAVADQSTQKVYLDRVADADRFATLADRALRTGHLTGVQDELTDYFQVYEIRAWLVDPNGQVLLHNGESQLSTRARSDPAVLLAERGVTPGPPDPVIPWDSDSSMVVAVPVGQGSDVIAVVVIQSPIDHLQHLVALRWGLLTACVVLLAVVLVLTLVPVARWVLRPVHLLEGAVHEITAGHLESAPGCPAAPSSCATWPHRSTPWRPPWSGCCTANSSLSATPATSCARL